LDLALIIGIVLGLGAVVGGALLEGLHLGSIAQPTAAIIVFGGTIGATALSFPLKTVLAAGKSIARVLLERKVKLSRLVQRLRQNSLVPRNFHP
jgi:chemotaxis protein MotA